MKSFVYALATIGVLLTGVTASAEARTVSFGASTDQSTIGQPSQARRIIQPQSVLRGRRFAQRRRARSSNRRFRSTRRSRARSFRRRNFNRRNRQFFPSRYQHTGLPNWAAKAFEPRGSGGF